MAGSLIKIQEVVASNSANVTLTGMSSTYNVYKFVMTNVIPINDNVHTFARFTESGTPNTTSNYDAAYKNLNTSSFSNSSYTNRDNFYLINNYIGTPTGETGQAVCYIFNSQESGEYTFITQEITSAGHTYSLWGNQGGGVMTVSSVVDGIQIYMESGNIASGIFSLYGLRK